MEFAFLVFLISILHLSIENQSTSPKIDSVVKKEVDFSSKKENTPVEIDRSQKGHGFVGIFLMFLIGVGLLILIFFICNPYSIKSAMEKLFQAVCELSR